MTITTSFEMEFFHLTIDPLAPQRITPTPDEMLTPIANTPERVITSNGLLLWMMDDSIVRGNWCPKQQTFVHFDNSAVVNADSVRAWAVLPSLARGSL